MRRALVTGAAGFIGGHLCRYLKERNYHVYATDYAAPRYGTVVCNASNWNLDLRDYDAVEYSFHGMEWCDEIYHLAADMGGMGFIGHSSNQLDIMRNNVMINGNLAKVAWDSYPQEIKVLFTSSACVYPRVLQAEMVELVETDAWRGEPDDAYGIEKLFSERLWRHVASPTGLSVHIARFHNIFGPYGSWNDGREKAPAAMCRKVATAKLTGNPEVEIWGDGKAVRSFCYIDDCLEMLFRLTQSQHQFSWDPINIGTDRAVTINGLADIIADAAGVKIEKKYVSGPRGVHFRNADLTKMREVLDYEPQWSLEDGLKVTYDWIEEQVAESLDGPE